MLRSVWSPTQNYLCYPCIPCPDEFNVKLNTIIFVNQNNNCLIVRRRLWILAVVHSLRSLRVLPVVVGRVWGREPGGSHLDRLPNDRIIIILARVGFYEFIRLKYVKLFGLTYTRMNAVRVHRSRFYNNQLQSVVCNFQNGELSIIWQIFFFGGGSYYWITSQNRTGSFDYTIVHDWWLITVFSLIRGIA